MGSGEVIVTESASIRQLIRRLPSFRRGIPACCAGESAGAGQSLQTPASAVAGAIVTAGKQDRVIAKDRLVPAETDPVALMRCRLWSRPEMDRIPAREPRKPLSRTYRAVPARTNRGPHIVILKCGDGFKVFAPTLLVPRRDILRRWRSRMRRDAL